MNYTGLLNINKEKGMTSMSVCAQLRRILHVSKVGHAGTLDPMAEGVLPVAFGRACKSVDEVGNEGKTYEAGMLLGIVTDTLDITGNVISRYEGLLPDEAAVKEAILSFQGGYDQLTPMYSARHIDGKRLYDLARSGMEVERPSKWIDIDNICILSINGPHVRFRISCSKGTYVRSLCNDIGERLGCGACMESLLRTRVGNFELSDAFSIQDVQKLEKAGIVDSALRIVTPTAVSIGKFDGTHLGHQALLKQLRITAEREHLRSLVLILTPPGKRIEDRERRKNRILSMGIDYVIELALNDDIKQMSAEDFLQKILIERYCMHYLVGGKDISFGYQKRGNAEFLKENADKLGFKYKLIDKVTISEKMLHTGEDVTEMSSMLLRKVIESGNMEAAEAIMGRNYSIEGKTIKGRHLGSELLHTPTANIPVSDTIELPPFGVYLSRITVRNKDDRKYRNDLTAPKGKNDTVYYGISNLGVQPTVSSTASADNLNKTDQKVQLETHIFDLDPAIGNDMYGKDLNIELLHFIRPEKQFDSMEELREQVIGKDIPEAYKVLNSILFLGVLNPKIFD